MIDSAKREVWPADRFYWAVLEAPRVRAGVLPVELRDDLASAVPVDVNDLHAVCIPIEGERVVVCALSKRQLEELPPSVTRLVPQSLPGWVQEILEQDAISGGSVPLHEMNLLCGEFEHQSVQRARDTQRIWLAMVLGLSMVMLCIGMMRRTSRWQEQAIAYRAAADQVPLSYVGATGEAGRDRLSSALENVQDISSYLHRGGAPVDVTSELSRLLAGWPAGLEARAMMVSADRITVTARVTGDVQEGLRAFRAMGGWKVGEPRITSSAQGVLCVVEFERAAGVSR